MRKINKLHRLLNGLLDMEDEELWFLQNLINKLDYQDVKQIGYRIREKLLEDGYADAVKITYEYVLDKLVQAGYLTKDEVKQIEIYTDDTEASIIFEEQLFNKLRKIYKETKDPYIKFVLF